MVDTWDYENYQIICSGNCAWSKHWFTILILSVTDMSWVETVWHSWREDNRITVNIIIESNEIRNNQTIHAKRVDLWMLWVVMAECCNNELVQNSYSKFVTAFLDIIIEVKNSLFDALETSQVRKPFLIIHQVSP